MSTTFGSSICVGERLQVVRGLSREQCEAALANLGSERLQATVIKALQARMRALDKVRPTQGVKK